MGSRSMNCIRRLEKCIGLPPAERIAAVDPAAVHARIPLERTWNQSGAGADESIEFGS